ncbi:MAG TPA: tetratricopeptide repeat protein [Geobacteraceae bacterium]
MEHSLREAEKCHAAGDYHHAAARYRALLAEFPHLSRTAYNLGNILKDEGRYDEAEIFFRQALAAEPELFEAALNLAFTLQEQGKIEEACAAYTVLARQQAELPDARFNLACLRLLNGDMPSGWEGYELRFATQEPVPPRHESLPLWDGMCQPGLRLLVHTEQGYGDALHMCRYLPLLANAGLRVLVETTPPLVPLLARLPGVECCIPRGTMLPQIDAQIPIMSLPRLLRTTLDTIPPLPPIDLDESALRRMARLLPASETLRVGLAWAGRLKLPVNRKRSCPASLITRLLDIPGVTFVSLQPDTPSQFRLDDPRLLAFGNELHDFHDTAALISNLDLVITIDTAVAHLAGTLGKPTWLLLPHVPDWRWLLDRTDSPWYPSLHLFRQPAVGAWEPVIGHVRTELERLVRPTVFVYRAERDFAPHPHLGERLVPLLASPSRPVGETPLFDCVEDPEGADFFLFPYYLENLTEFAAIEGLWRFLDKLPYLAAREEDHIFFSDHDSAACYHTTSLWFRASVDRRRRDNSCYALPYVCTDVAEQPHFDAGSFRYHTSFVGYLGVRRQRSALINSLVAEHRLVTALDLAEAFHGHQTPEVQQMRRQRYLELSAQSLTILCPAGDGANSIRFFEALALGRLPILAADCLLPFEDRIDYDRFVLRISSDETESAGKLVHDWLTHFSDQELMTRCHEARQTWEEWFAPASRAKALWGQAVRHRIPGTTPGLRPLASRRQSPPSTAAHPNRETGDPLAVVLRCLEEGDLAGAEQHVREALARTPRSSRLHLLLGLVLKRAGSPGKAERALEEAILYDHRCHDAYLELGMLLAETDRAEEAVERLYEASLLRPDGTDAYRAAIPLLLRLKRHAEARYCLLRMHELGATDGQFLQWEHQLQTVSTRAESS